MLYKPIACIERDAKFKMRENLLDQKPWKQIIEDLQNGLMVLGERGKICYANPTMCGFLETDAPTSASVAGLMEHNMRRENDAFFESILDTIELEGPNKQIPPV